MTRSLRGRLLLGTAIAAVLVLSASGAILYFLMSASLVREFDTSLRAKAKALTTLVEQDGDRVKFEFENLNMPEFERSDRPEYFQAWRADGSVLARSKSLGQGSLDRIGGVQEIPSCRSQPLPDGRRGRLICMLFRPRQENEDEGENRAQAQTPQAVTLTVACETADIDRTLATLALLLAGIWAAATAVMLGVLAVVVRRGLRPAEHLATCIGRLDASDLSARVELPDAPEELTPVIGRLNDLLGRMEAAFSREKGFTADVAHELRTPLAGLRTTLEISASQVREPGRYLEAVSDCLAITQQMQAMVDNLLWLTRAEAGQVRVTREPVGIGELLEECWRTVADRARSRNLQVEWQIRQDCALATDREKLRQALCNLMENAVAYADDGGRVQFGAGCEGNRVRCRLVNTGSRVSTEQSQRVFDRFWRGDAARTDTGTHCGLGLSLSRKIITLLGGTISVTSSVGGEFAVTVEFPVD